jgi:predicted metal-dependent phosphoesterase TrpH
VHLLKKQREENKIALRPRPLKADLHLHTAEDPHDRISYTARDLIDWAANEGFEVLSITNHQQLTFNKNLSSYARERGILLIPGIELTIRKRHVLVLNPPREKTFPDFSFLSAIRRPETLVIAPHPFFPNPRSINGHLLKHLELFDALEYCHFYSPRINFNHRAIRVSKRYGLPLVGNSDSHFLSQFGTTYSLIYAEKNPEAIFEAIRNNRVEIVTRPLSSLQLGFLLGRFFSMKVQQKKIKALQRQSLRFQALRSQFHIPSF